MNRFTPISPAILVLLLVGCVRPSQGEQAPTVESSANELAASPEVLATEEPPSERRIDCVDGASFLQDLTVPDGSQVSPGEIVDKRWSVENSGSCDWGLGYRLIPQEPNPLAQGKESALFPAKSGSTATWRVSFPAPQDAGEYLGAWQAFNPQGQAFGDPVFVLINVTESQSPE